MAQTILKIALLSAISTVLASPAPLQTRHLQKRWEEGVDCTWNYVDAPPGLFFAIGSDGTSIYCDVIGDVSADQGARCYVTNDNPDELGTMTKCPCDPAPAKKPDGTESESPADGFIKTWCDVGGAGGALGEFASTIGCFIYGYYEAQGDPIAEAESGAMGVCDSIFAGACTWFLDIAPEIAEGMSRPCTEDGESNACDFANPGKKA